jgi:proteasome accessory factor C
MTTSPVQERLRRLLFLVPYVVRNPGLPVGDVAAALGVSTDQLLEELDLLTLVGRPPFQPDDFVDIYVDDDGRVYVKLDQRLSSPPRLTAEEGVALAAALLQPESNDALQAALTKLEGVLPPLAVARYRQMARQLDVAAEGPDPLAALSQATAERREVVLDYFTASRGQTEQRRVQPWELLSHLGQWYLSAFCLTRGGERLFKVDRIARLEVTDTQFAAPPARQAPARPGGTTAQPVTVRFAAARAPYIRERFAGQVREVGGGEVEVEVPGDSERWLSRWVLSFAGDARVTAPAAAVQVVANAARAALEM